MEGPFDPQHPGQDAGASQPEAQDGDLHALLERLLGQADLRPAAPGAGGDLWPDLFAATPLADEASTIVPAPDAPTAVAELPADVADPAASVELAPRAWEPVVVDASSTTTNVDDIHAAILASVSVELEPIAPAVAFDAAAEVDLEIEASTVDAPAFDHAALEALLAETAAFDTPPAEWSSEWSADVALDVAAEPALEPAAEPIVELAAEPTVEAAPEPAVELALNWPLNPGPNQSPNRRSNWPPSRSRRSSTTPRPGSP